MIRQILISLFFFIMVQTLPAQTYSFGWSGTELVPKTTLLNPANWTTNVASAASGDKSVISSSADTLKLNWTFGTGNRDKWAQAYIYFPQALSLAGYDLFGFNLKGMPNAGYVGFELKFEDGSHQAVVRWDGLAGLNRWAENISVAKKQFSNASVMDWNHVKVISVAVYAAASAQYTNTDQGSVGMYNLHGTNMAAWSRVASREFINPNDVETIKQNALNAIINRQTSTGLLTTWAEDNSSWLYGQGLALKALSLEGSWNLGVPSNTSAIAAEKLALFLSAHQEPEGYWPRAWDSQSGAIKILREADGTIWMGDFPWIITGLQAYYKKSGDQRVKPAIQKGLNFLKNLIMPDGQFFTINPQSGIKTEVASCEAYAAAMLALFESGETALGDHLYNYISSHAWDPDVRCWREATYSDRIVLFANTWMSYYDFQKGETQKGLDALTLAGKVLYTRGNGQMFGMDGIVPLAVWMEGTLSYIAAGGPGSISLFEQVKNQIKQDGMVPHYNENLGGMAGIWAVTWHSLDGTSWLYFTAAGKSPFDVLEGIPVGLKYSPARENQKHFAVFAKAPGIVAINPLNTVNSAMKIRVFQMDGRLVMERKAFGNAGEIDLKIAENGLAEKMVFVQISGPGMLESYPLILF